MRRLIAAAVVILLLAVADSDPIDQLLHGELASPPAAPAAGVAPIFVPSAGPITCEAVALAYLVGRPKSEIPVPVDPSHRRVSCTTCPVTEDYRPDRTDILFDQTTGLITAVKCG